jgi:putative peptidoglycan lipid II flippase
MFKKIRSIENNFTVAKAATIIGAFTLLIKLVAIYRERLFSGTFGQGPILDSYYSAFRVPDFLTTLLVTSTLSVAFLPMFSSIRAQSEEESGRFTNQVLIIISLIVGFLCLVLLMLSRPLTHALVPGFTGGQFDDTLKLTRLFLVSPVIFALGTIYGAVLNAKKLFLVSSFAPLLYNVGIISGVIFFYPRFGIIGLGYGVILGALAQLFVQIVAVYWNGFNFNFSFLGARKNLAELWKLYVPRIFSFDLSNITLLLGTVVGSALAAGSITGLNQAYNLQAVPIGVFGYPIALAVFPVLSELFAEKNEAKFTRALGKSISQTLFFIIPITILTLLFRAHVVRLILGTGKFTWEDTVRTFQILGLFSFSFFSQSLTTLLSRAFFARHNTKTPVLVNIGAVIINITLGVALGRAYGVLGLTSAFVFASIFNALILFMLIRRTLWKQPGLQDGRVLSEFDSGIFNTLWKVSAASIIMGLICWGLLHFLAQFLNTHTYFGLLVQAAVSGSFGLVAFMLVCQKLGLKYWPNFSSILGKKLSVEQIVEETDFSDKTKN